MFKNQKSIAKKLTSTILISFLCIMMIFVPTYVGAKSSAPKHKSFSANSGSYSAKKKVTPKKSVKTVSNKNKAEIPISTNKKINTNTKSSTKTATSTKRSY